MQFTFQLSVLCRPYRACQFGRCNKIAAPSKTIPHIARIWGDGMEGVLQKNFWRYFFPTDYREESWFHSLASYYNVFSSV